MNHPVDILDVLPVSAIIGICGYSGSFDTCYLFFLRLRKDPRSLPFLIKFRVSSLFDIIDAERNEIKALFIPKPIYALHFKMLEKTMVVL